MLAIAILLLKFAELLPHQDCMKNLKTLFNRANNGHPPRFAPGIAVQLRPCFIKSASSVLTDDE